MVELSVENFKKIYSIQVGKNSKFFKPKEVQTLLDLGQTWTDEEIKESIASLG